MKKNICLILPGKLPVPNVKGGAIETLLTLLIDQNEIDRQVHFIVVCAWTEGIEEVAKRYRYTEFHYFRIRNGAWKKSINLINYVISRVTGIVDFFTTPMHRDIEKIVANIDADAVVVEHGVYKHFEFLKKYFKKENLYLHIHGELPNLDRRTKDTFGNFICVSKYISDLYINECIKNNIKSKICLNGIHDNAFCKRISEEERTALRNKFDINSDDFLAIFCGRIITEKGVLETINGVLNTCNHHIKILVVGGSNFQDSKLTHYVKKVQNIAKNRSGQVILTGYIPNNELYKYYQAADIQMVCSLCEESAGLVAIEGAMSGLPLVITNSGGLPEYAKDFSVAVLNKGDSLFDTKSSQNLSKQIGNVLEREYARFLSKESRKDETRNLNEYGAKEYYRRFVNLFV